LTPIKKGAEFIFRDNKSGTSSLVSYDFPEKRRLNRTFRGIFERLLLVQITSRIN